MNIFLQISAQYGDPKASKIFFPIQKQLNQKFGREMDQSIVRSLNKISVILRVSGSTTNFNSSGPERLKLIKKDGELTIDLVVPEETWQGVPIDQVKFTLRSNLEACVISLLEKADQEHYLLDRLAVEQHISSVFDSVFN